MKKLAIIMTMVVALGAVTIVVAQKPVRSFDGDKPARGERGPDKEMLNKLVEARISFDAELSRRERSVIEEFREKFETFRESHPRKERGERNFHDRKNRRDQKPVERPFTPEEMKPLMEIAKNHKESLKEIFEELRPENGEHPDRKDRPEWKNRPEGKPCPEGERNMGPRGDRMKRGVVRFLLLDPSKGETGMIDESSPVFIYPNPASDVLNVQLTVEESQQVKIELFNKSGSMHEVLFESAVPAGKQTNSFNIGHLPAKELYFVKTTIADKPITIKVVKN